MNTSYLLRTPGFDEIRAAFGSLSHAVTTTAGDIPTLCFYLANPERIPPADACKPVDVAATSFSRDLRTAADDDLAAAAFKSQKKPTIAATAAATGLTRGAARKALVRVGLWPRKAIKRAA